MTPRLAFFPQLTHPLESIFSLVLKAVTWNSVSAPKLLVHFRRSGDLHALPRPKGSGSKLGSVDLELLLLAFGLDPSTRFQREPASYLELYSQGGGWIHRDDAFRSEIYICPQCFGMGYHFPLFQLDLLDRCPEHGEELLPILHKIIDEGSSRQKPWMKIADPSRSGNESVWPSGYSEPVASPSFPKIEFYLTRLADAGARRLALVRSRAVLEISAGGREFHFLFNKVLFPVRPASDSTRTRLECSLGYYKRPASEYLECEAPVLARLLTVPDSIRNRNFHVKQNVDISRVFLAQKIGEWPSLGHDTRKLSSLVHDYADVGMALGAWKSAFHSYRNHFRSQHRSCVALVRNCIKSKNRPSAPIPCEHLHAYELLVRHVRRDFRDHTNPLFRSSFDWMSCELWNHLRLTFSIDASLWLFRRILERLYFAYFLDLHLTISFRVRKEIDELEASMTRLEMTSENVGRLHDSDWLAFHGFGALRLGHEIIKSALCNALLPGILINSNRSPASVSTLQYFTETEVPIAGAQHLIEVRKSLTRRLRR